MAIPRMIYLGTEKMNNSGAFNADIFAKNLREARKNKNWTQSQLAEEVNKKGFSIRGATNGRDN